MLLESNDAENGATQEYWMDMFMLLLKEVAGNFPSCQLLKEDYVRDNVQNPQ